VARLVLPARRAAEPEASQMRFLSRVGSMKVTASRWGRG
jgi:hypothetical protein